MTKPETTLPKSVRDILPEKTAIRNTLVGKILSVFKKKGFKEVTTPLLEYLDVITQGAGKDLRKKVVKFTDRATGRSITLRPDFTPQIARIVATHYRGHKEPIRLSYHGSVLRLADDASGGQKELYQAGAELIGDPTPSADAEIIETAVEALKAGGLERFMIDIGQVEFVRGTLDEADIPPMKMVEILDAISKKDISKLNEMTAGMDKKIREALTVLPYLFGGEDVFKKAVVTGKRSEDALNGLKEVVKILIKKGYSKYITIDLGEIRGFDYHTGIIFEGFVGGIGSAICSGGRYDNLLAGFGYPSPATGFAIDVDSLMAAIEKQG